MIRMKILPSFSRVEGGACGVVLLLRVVVEVCRHLYQSYLVCW
jgi:hypothetical protein